MNIRFKRLHAGEKLITFLQCPPIIYHIIYHIPIKEPPVEEEKKKQNRGQSHGRTLRDAPQLRFARRTTNDPNKETATTGTKVR